MGFSLETTNYKLGQYAGTDKPNYTTDYNGNMAKIDAALKAVSDAGGETGTSLEDTKDRVSALETNVGKNTEDITSVTATAEQNARDIVSANSEIEALQTKNEEFDDDISNIKSNIETLKSADASFTSTIASMQEKESNIENTIATYPNFELLSGSYLGKKIGVYNFRGNLRLSHGVNYTQISLPFNMDSAKGEGGMLLCGYITDGTASPATISSSNVKVLGMCFAPLSDGDSTLWSLILYYSGTLETVVTSFNLHYTMLYCGYNKK